jgi:hypothetical protein
VYQCVIDGQKVFSDRACGEGSQSRDIPAPNRMEAYEPGRPKSAETKSSSEKPAKNTASAAAKRVAEKNKRCAKLRADQQLLTSRLRAGYSLREGERLNERLSKLNAEYYALRCAG